MLKWATPWLCLAAAICFLAVPAKADTIAFNSTTSAESSWSLSGSPSLLFSLQSDLTSVQVNSNTPNTSITGGTIGWTTGAASYVSSNMIIFAPGGSITVNGDVGNGVESLFTGTFQNAGVTLLSGGSSASSSFSASFVAGSINPDLYSFLGLGNDSPDVTGSLTATLNGGFSTSGGSGGVAGASITLDPPTVPEPSTLVLLATGLLSLALIRRFGFDLLKTPA